MDQDRKPVINKDIQVDTVSSKQASTGNMKWIITDTNKLKYFFWQNNKGELSEVYKSFTGMGVKKGGVIHIGYTESPESFVNREGKTVNYTDRFILGLREASGASTTQSPTQPESPRYEAPTHSQRESSDAFGRRLAIHGFINGMLAGGADPGTLDDRLLKDLLALEDRIDAALKPVTESKTNVRVSSPEVQQILDEQDIDVEDIPF